MGERAYADEELEKARESLADAERLEAANGSDAGIVNRLYYACFHAAQATLYDRGVDPQSHGGVRQLFGEELVLGGGATREQGRLLTKLADLREQADYGYEPLDVDVGTLGERTAAFVDAMEDLIGETPGQGDE